MRRAGLCLTLTLLATAAGGQDGGPLYVGDRFQIGVHEEQSLSSTILELVPSGTVLEVLARDGDLVQVRTPGGTSGWVDAAFLSNSEPGRSRVESMEAELAGAQAALADAQAKLVALESQPAASSEPDAPISSDALREMQLLAEENQRLKQQVAELEAVQRMAVERDVAPETPAAAPEPQAVPPPPPDPVDVSTTVMGVTALGRWETWQVVLLASVLLLAFGAGGWLVDWGIRRRHGGFRV